jgi:YmgG-like glycine-zipper protein
MASETASGAASGAAQGAAVGGPYGALIGAGIGAISGFMSGRRRKKAERAERRRQERIRQKASPQHLAAVIQSLQPVFREIVASGLGPQFQTQVNDSLAKHGLTGTGVGEAFRSSAAAAPAIFATQGATSEANQVVNRELYAEGVAGPEPSPAGNPLMDALMGGARGYFAMSAGNPAPPTGAPGVFSERPITGGRGYTDTIAPNIESEFPSSPGAMVSDASGKRFIPKG